MKLASLVLDYFSLYHMKREANRVAYKLDRETLSISDFEAGIEEFPPCTQDIVMLDKYEWKCGLFVLAKKLWTCPKNSNILAH